MTIYDNDTLRVLRERSSIRAFLPQGLSEDQIAALEAAALAAPTAVNRQGNRFSFITNPELMAKINAEAFAVLELEGQHEVIGRMEERGGRDLFYGAPLLVVISSEDNGEAGVDAGIAVQSLALAAQSLKLGSCIIGLASWAFRRERESNCCAALEMAKDEQFRIAIAIGYPAMEKTPHEHDPSHIRRFGGAV